MRCEVDVSERQRLHLVMIVKRGGRRGRGGAPQYCPTPTRQIKFLMDERAATQSVVTEICRQKAAPSLARADGRTQSRTLTSTVSHAVCATHFFARPNNCVNARKNVVTVRLLLFLTILIVDPHSLRTRAAAYCQCPPGRPRLKSVRASSLQ